MIPMVIGTNARPDSSALKPLICWKYSEPKKKNACMPESRNSVTKLAVVSVRFRKIDSLTSGCLALLWVQANAPSSAIAAAPRPSVRALPQPKSCALTMA